MPHHSDGGYSLPETIHLREVAFCHDSLFEAFREWLRSRGLDLVVFPPGCHEADADSSVNTVAYIITTRDLPSPSPSVDTRPKTLEHAKRLLLPFFPEAEMRLSNGQGRDSYNRAYIACARLLGDIKYNQPARVRKPEEICFLEDFEIRDLVKCCGDKIFTEIRRAFPFRPKHLNESERS